MERTIPIIHLSAGEEITPRVPINDVRARNWKHHSECDPIHGTLIPGARLRIVEVSKRPGAMWVRVQIPGRSPAAFLKLAGDEYASAFQSVSASESPTGKPDLFYNIASGRLAGVVDGNRFDDYAGSGGRAGSKVEGAANWRLQNNPLATHVGGKRSAGTHNFGPIPNGRYALQVHETRTNWVRLVPEEKNIMYERRDFAIHGRGQVGSHGCIVPSDFGVVLRLIALLQARASRGAPAPTLEVVAVGSDVDKKFRAV
jgi:hypothetical protein